MSGGNTLPLLSTLTEVTTTWPLWNIFIGLEIFKPPLYKVGLLFARCDPAGIGYGGILILIYSCMTYIIILSWALLYLLFSFRSQLPWGTCNNYWNSGKIDPGALWMDFTSVAPVITEKFSFRVLYFSPKWHKWPEQPDQHNLCCHWILGVCWWCSSFWVVSSSRFVVIVFFPPGDECWLSQGASRRSGVSDGKFYCV